MAADRLTLASLMLIAGCAGAPSATPRDPVPLACDPSTRFPVRACDRPTRPDLVGAWGPPGELVVLVYDGCSVVLAYEPDASRQEDGWLEPLRPLLDGRAVLDLSRFGDTPYFRTAATWRDGALVSRSVLGEHVRARLDDATGQLFGRSGQRLERLTDARALDPGARRMLCLDRVVPTREEVARALGVREEPNRCRAGRPTPCASSTHPERVGAWRDESGLTRFVFDGCTVAFVHPAAERWDPGAARLVAVSDGALLVDPDVFGDPAPYQRARADMDRGWLVARSLASTTRLARWHAASQRFVAPDGGALQRVEAAEPLDDVGQQLLCVRTVVPTSEELAERLELQ